MRYCGNFLIKAEGGAKNYKHDHPLPSAWRSFTLTLVQRKGLVSKTGKISSTSMYLNSKVSLAN